MLVSMTGFGSAAHIDEAISIKVEIRSVNHRYFDTVVRLPQGYAALEEPCRLLVSRLISRGRVEISVRIEEFDEGKRTVQLDRALLQEYVNAFEEAGTLLQKEISFNSETLIALPGLFIVTESEQDPDKVWILLEPVLTEAAKKLVAMRRVEGERLGHDIRERLSRFEAILADIASQASNSVEQYRTLLTRRVEELLGHAPVDEQRIAQEIALYADKANIDEEITRAKIHVEQVLKTCNSHGSVGRKLDFLIQELNREVNTMASKVHDALIANLVVEAKSELEKIREQIQNVE